MALRPVPSLQDGRKVIDKFVVFRVSNVGNAVPGLKIVTNMSKLYDDEQFELRSTTGMWIYGN